MLNNEWPAEDYAIGSYIQATVADRFLPDLQLQPNARILDVGCGNGAYSRKILAKVPQGSVLGVDASNNMLHLAKEVMTDYPNFSVQNKDVLDLSFADSFDGVVSFWCLQWISDIRKAFDNMIHALKPGGTLFTLFPAGDDPFITSYYAIRDSGQLPFLKNFKSPIDYSRLDNLAQKLKSIPCKQLKVDLYKQSITLPSLEIFRKFIYGIAFYQGQLTDKEIKQANEAMIQYYDEQCQKKYQGIYKFEFSIYLVTGEQ